MISFLSPGELESLTGYQKPTAQMRWLRDNGYPHEVGGDGAPKVLEQLVLARLGGAAAKKKGPELRL